MSGPLASWVGEHSKLGAAGVAVVKEYALAADHWGNPTTQTRRESIEHRTRLSRATVIRARNDAVKAKELEELDRPGGRSRPGSFRVVIVLCPEDRACWSCAELKRLRARKKVSLSDRFADDELDADTADTQSGRPGEKVSQRDRNRRRRPVDNSKKRSHGETVSPRKGLTVSAKGLTVTPLNGTEELSPTGERALPGESDDRAPSPSQAPARSGARRKTEPTALGAALGGAVPPPAVAELRRRIEADSRSAKVDGALGRRPPPSAERLLSAGGNAGVSGDLNAASGAPEPADGRAEAGS